jgi:putative transposase
VRYRCIDRRRDRYPVRMMCRLLKVSRSGYYDWRSRPESTTAKMDRELTRVIRRIHADSRGTYGSPRVTAEIRDQGYRHGQNKVARLMRIAGLRGCPQRRFKVTTQRDPSHPVAKNLLEQDFSAEAANQRWASDITYLRTRKGWLYLAVVMDLYSRRIVGWSMSRRISRHLVMDALTMAVEQRCPEGTLIHHSDRGSQYTSDDFRELLEAHGITCSMSSRGNCYDNAVVESFFGLLKRERANRVYLTPDEARADAFDYIECFYNRKRRHGYLGNISPAAFEERTMGPH